MDPKNILDEALIPNKDAEITKDVSRYRKQYVSPTYRSSFIPYSYNVTQRSGDYQDQSDSPMKKLQKNMHE